MKVYEITKRINLKCKCGSTHSIKMSNRIDIQVYLSDELFESIVSNIENQGCQTCWSCSQWVII